jgi:hypothetical protein
MKKSLALIGGIAGGLFFVTGVMAEDFQAHSAQCVEKFANPNLDASVTLECTAGGGKLSDCKVVSNTAEGKGFDKAAICLADYLPMGAKTGTIRVPLRFQSAS